MAKTLTIRLEAALRLEAIAIGVEALFFGGFTVATSFMLPFSRVERSVKLKVMLRMQWLSGGCLLGYFLQLAFCWHLTHVGLLSLVRLVSWHAHGRKTSLSCSTGSLASYPRID